MRRTKKAPTLPLDTADFVLLSNVIHGTKDKLDLLRRATLIARPGGAVIVMNWRVVETPRGPPMEMRPTPDQIVQIASEAGLIEPTILDIPPYHYVVMAHRKLE